MSPIGLPIETIRPVLMALPSEQSVVVRPGTGVRHHLVGLAHVSRPGMKPLGQFARPFKSQIELMMDAMGSGFFASIGLEKDDDATSSSPVGEEIVTDTAATTNETWQET